MGLKRRVDCVTSVVCVLAVALLFDCAACRANDRWAARPYVVGVEVMVVGTIGEDVIHDAIAEGLGPACRLADADVLAEADKRITVKVRSAGSRTLLSVTERDLWSHLDDVTVLDLVADSRLVESAISESVRRAFRPRVLIERRDDVHVASVWGSRLDGDLLAGRQWFRPAIRFHDRDEQWRETREIAWTFVRLEASASLNFAVHVESAFPQPLPGRLRRGALVALAVPIVSDGTDLHLVDRVTGQPRVGLGAELTAVDVADTAPDGDSEEEAIEPVRLTADRLGAIRISGSDLLDNGALVRLRVLSTNVLADVPIVVGASESVTLPLVPDVERVELEERLEAIEADLQELVAQRSVLLAAIRKGIDANDWAAVEPMLPKLDELPKAATLLVALNAARVAAVDSAVARGDRTAASRLRRRAAQVERTIKEFADPDVDADMRSEIATLREIEDAAKAFKKPSIERIKTDE